MAEQQTLDRLIADSYRRGVFSAVLPYVLLGIVLAGMFVWRVAVTDPDWDTAQNVTVPMP